MYINAARDHLMQTTSTSQYSPGPLYASTSSSLFQYSPLIPHQAEVFETALEPRLNDVLCGFEATVFAYGQTGTGKTYTMEGDIMDENKKGLIPRSMTALFDRLNSPVQQFIAYEVSCSYLEIYNEELTDLLFDCEEARNMGASPTEGRNWSGRGAEAAPKLHIYDVGGRSVRGGWERRARSSWNMSMSYYGV